MKKLRKRPNYKILTRLHVFTKVHLLLTNPAIEKMKKDMACRHSSFYLKLWKSKHGEIVNKKSIWIFAPSDCKEWGAGAFEFGSVRGIFLGKNVSGQHRKRNLIMNDWTLTYKLKVGLSWINWVFAWKKYFFQSPWR